MSRCGGLLRDGATVLAAQITSSAKIINVQRRRKRGRIHILDSWPRPQLITQLVISGVVKPLIDLRTVSRHVARVRHSTCPILL